MLNSIRVADISQLSSATAKEAGKFGGKFGGKCVTRESHNKTPEKTSRQFDLNCNV